MQNWKYRLRMIFNRIFRRAEWAKMEADVRAFKAQMDEKGFQAEATIHHENMSIITGMLVDAFRAMNGVNFVQWRVVDPVTMTQYEVTMRPAHGRMPAEVNAILREALEKIGDRATSGDHWTGYAAREALFQCGYFEKMEMGEMEEMITGGAERV